MFIAVDGIDGSGKTTLVRQLAECLIKWNPLVTKEPTNTSMWGIALREAAIKGRLSQATELEYFRADRKHHLETEIIPALNHNRIVIADRYVDSTLAFQALTPRAADALYLELRGEIILPDVTYILDCPVDIGLHRIAARDGGVSSAFETRETLSRARDIYKSRTDDHYAILDASGSIECTFKQALQVLLQRHGNRREGLSETIEKSLGAFRKCNTYNLNTRIRVAH